MPRRGIRVQPKPIGDPNDPESLYNYLLRFQEYSRVRNITERTIETRTICNRKFLKWCDERGLNRPCDITKPILERYQRHLFFARKDNGQPLSTGAQLSNLLSIKSYFQWLAVGNHILYNPASDLILPKVSKRLPRNILTSSQADTIMNQPDVNTTQGIRDRAMLEVLYSTGIRRMELTNLKIQDINIEYGSLMVVHGKGDKDRMIPVGDRAVAWVKKYINEVRPQFVIGASECQLFLNEYGEPMGNIYLSRIVTRYIKNANVGITGSCHMFRHTMASLMLENGADIRYVQMMLGHASLETTQIYTQVNIGKLKEIHTATHPARNKPRKKQPESSSERSGKADT